MADIRINALPTTATDFASDDYIAIDGTTNGTRKLNAKTANLTFSDVTLGTSGPSVKSSLSARAPRQGLVLNGTAAATCSVTALGSTDFTVGGWVYQASAATAGLIAGASGSIAFYLLSNGTLRADRLGTGSTTASTGTVTAGKFSQVLYVRSGTTGTYYINGVAAGTTSDSFNYSTAISIIGGDSASTNVLNGYFFPIVENRALSASEVVALYEAGAPAGADYNNATNTAFTNGTFANVGYSTFSGASATGFIATYGGGGEAAATSQIANLAVAPGRKYLIKFDLTLTSGTAPYVGLAQFGVQWLTGSAAVTTGQVRAAAGANSIVVTIRSVNATFATGAGVGFASQEASSFTVSNLTATPLGLLLAPDAAQAGGGLVWYDTSGNAANITLPASGVSWNVPSSLKLGGNWNLAGTLTSTVTSGSSPILTASNTSSGGYSIIRAQNDVGGASGNFDLGIGGSGVGGSYQNWGYLYTGGGLSGIRFATTATIQMTLNNSGNLLIGTTTDAGYKLQVSGTAQFTFGGSDSYFGYGATNDIYLTNGNSGKTVIRNATGAENLVINNTGATFAGNVTASGQLKSTFTSDYCFYAAPSSGANRNIAIFGVAGATNGFTIKWDNASATMRVNIQNLPTSATGLAAGDLYNSGGTLKIA